MSAQPRADGTEVAYRCGCGQLLLIAPVALREGVVRGVYCRGCGKRATVYLGGRRGRPELVGDADPARPPIEAGPIRDARGRRR